MTPTDRPMPARHFGPTGPITWAFLSPEREAEQIAELRLWVDWLAWRFSLDHRTIPACWPEHGPLVEELSALYTSWQDAYTDSADATAPLHWMAQFAAARDRLREWSSLTGCQPGTHREHNRPALPGRASPKAAATSSRPDGPMRSAGARAEV